jgi:predicted GTPase
VIARTASLITVETPDRIRGERVLVIEDGPTITHGSMPSGAGLAAAVCYGADVIDPRPWAQGALREAYESYPHIGPVLPALGYTPEQVADLAATISAVPCDLIVAATPVDITRLIPVTVPVLRVSYDVVEETGSLIRDAFVSLLRSIPEKGVIQ